MTMLPSLTALPNELVDYIVHLLDPNTLRQFNSVSRWAYDLSLPLIWRHLELVDQPSTTPFKESHDVELYEYHDDTAIINKLVTIAR